MKGRLVYGDIFHEPAAKPWLAPVLFGTNAALFGLGSVITPTSRVVFREPIVPDDAKSDGRPLIYVTWHRLNYVCTPMFLALAPELRPTIIAHDGVASRAFSHQSCAWLGSEYVHLSPARQCAAA